MGESLTLDEYKWVLVTVVCFIIIPWAVQEILERKCNLAPYIMETDELQRISATKQDSDEHFKMNRQLTKSLDIEGVYRIQSRASIYFIKAVYQIILFIAFFLIMDLDIPWMLDHFIYLKADSVNHIQYLHVSASLVGYYSWECVANRYGKLSYSQLIHHWFTVGIALAILLGRYTPFATWFGFSAVSTSFPVNIALGFRAHFAGNYPDFTRKMFKFTYYYYMFVILFNLSGQVFLVCNALIYHYNESIHVGFVVVMIVCIIIWSYDDVLLLKALKAFSKQKYEFADLFQSTGIDGQYGSKQIQSVSPTADMVLKSIEMRSLTPDSLEDEEIDRDMLEVFQQVQTTNPDRTNRYAQ